MNSKYLKYFIFIFIAFASSFSYSKSLDYDSLLISDTIKYEPSFFSTFQLKDRYSEQRYLEDHIELANQHFQ